MGDSVMITRFSKHNDGYESEQVVVHMSNGGKEVSGTPVDDKLQAKGVESNNNDAENGGGGGEEREGWGNKVQFILAIVGFAVGLGNVWRFPYLAQKNGGGAFLIPYIIALITMGVPLFFLELAIGQRLRKAPIGVWNQLAPKFAGLGFAAVVLSWLVSIYYNVVVAWCLYYFVISFFPELPYKTCPMVNNITVPECEKAGRTQFYWYRQVHEISENIEDGGGMNWKLCVCLLVAWILVFLITMKGPKSMGKVVYFTALFPYVVLFIFFIRGLTLPGYDAGIKKMFTPDFTKLATTEVWLEASTQIFYSLGLGFGSLISMASYNRINNNCVRDAIMVSCINCGTSIFAGIVIFSILGYKATTAFEACKAGGRTDCDLKTFLDEVAEGPGLTFIAFTEAISTMPASNVWSVLFFLMILNLGVGSMIGQFEPVRSAFVDAKVIPFRKEVTCGILCVICYLLGLLMCQRSGEYWLQMFDAYSAGVGLLFVGLLEIIVVIYVYGLKKFSNDIFYMLGHSPNWYWKICWLAITPLLTIAIICGSCYGLFTNEIKYTRWNKEMGKVEAASYPPWGEALCIILILASIVFIPLIALLTHLDLFKIKKDEDLTASTNAENTMHDHAIAKSTSRMPLSEFEETPDRK